MASCAVTMHAATAPCASSGTLNVGYLLANQPFSAFDPVTQLPFGFDIDLVLAIAKILRLNVNFVGFVTLGAAEAALLANAIDVVANSATVLDLMVLLSFGAVVT